MALPPNFGHWEHLQNMLRRDHNKIVREYFRDLGGLDWDPEVNTSRGAIRTAATIDDKDTATITLIRLYYFYEILGYGKNNLIVYNGSEENISPPVAGHPKVYLFFYQDGSAASNPKKRLESEFSFRLMNETEKTFKPPKAKELAREIKKNFTVGRNGIRFDRGKLTCYMKDPINGFDYRRRMLVRRKSDAVDLYRRIYASIDKSFDATKVLSLEPDKLSTMTEGSEFIYDENVSLPGYRPTATLEFRYAYVEIPARKKPIFLVDLTGRNVALADI